MSEHKLERPGFTITHESFYWHALNQECQEIMIGDYPEDGGTCGELAIRWPDLGSGDRPPRLEAYGDSWEVLAAMNREHDFTNRLAKLAAIDEDMGPDVLVTALLDMGFEDMTTREDPSGVDWNKVLEEALAKLTPQERLVLGVKERPR